jgi:hypothetical protein
MVLLSILVVVSHQSCTVQTAVVSPLLREEITPHTNTKRSVQLIETSLKGSTHPHSHTVSGTSQNIELGECVAKASKLRILQASRCCPVC